MSPAAARLLAQYEMLPIDEKRQFVNALFRRLQPLDSGPLDDEALTVAGDQVAAILDEAENDAVAR